MNNKGIGYSAHFSGPMLVIEVHGKANKTFTILVKFEFRPQIVSINIEVFYNLRNILHNCLSSIERFSCIVSYGAVVLTLLLPYCLIPPDLLGLI